MVGSKTFISGAANVNIDLFFSGLPRLPEEGQELYSKGFSLQMGGGLPATLINLGLRHTCAYPDRAGKGYVLSFCTGCL